MNRQGRQTRPHESTGTQSGAKSTFTGNRGLDKEEGLIFELGRAGQCGVDLPEPAAIDDRLGGLLRNDDIGLPGLSEPEVVRHYVRVSRNNYAIDSGIYPLGSCTMKHNPRLNEKMARLPGFGDIHPLQPVSTVQGGLELIDTLAHWLKVITGMPAVAMSPAAGAHGELCGLMAIRTKLEADGDIRTRVLVPESAHGTNPATATMCGYKIDSIPATERGRVDLAVLKEKLGPDVAAVMLTNPNTCGLFEDEVIKVAEAIHSVGGYFYCDGANLNAVMGKVRVGDLGVDAMHINLHKTFSTPHGGGGARCGTRGAFRGPGGPCTGTLGGLGCGGVRACRRRDGRCGGINRADEGFSRSDGHVCPGTQLYDEPRCRWPASGLRRRRSVRQLRPGLAQGCHVAVL